jgi:hypothetical protein
VGEDGASPVKKDSLSGFQLHHVAFEHLLAPLGSF